MKLFVIYISSFLLISSVWAGTTGKLVGVVTDNDREPLIGVNIEIVNSGLGAASGADGFYLINNIPPGEYTIRATYISFNTYEIQAVRITVDQTTEINIKMSEMVMELDETITVVASHELIKKDVTSKRAVVGGEMITDILPVSTINDVVALQAGVVKDENGSLHMRGGRTGEVTYMIDGTYVKDPFDNSIGGNVDVEAVQEMEVISGTFNAEYGNALSGIVNIVTKDGSNDFKFKFAYESPMLNESPYHKADWMLHTDIVDGMTAEEKDRYRDFVRREDGTSAYEHVSVIDGKFSRDKTFVDALGKFNSSLSGPVPFIKNLFFFVSGTFENRDYTMPYGFSLNRVLSSKVTYRPISSLKFQLNYDWSTRWYQSYDHQYKYWNYAEETGSGSYPVWNDQKDRLSFKISHTLSNTTFYTLSFAKVDNFASREIEERDVYWNSETGDLDSTNYITRGYFSGAEGNFRNGDDRYWYKTESTTYDVDFDLTSQVNRYHQVKFGLEYRRHDMFRHRIGMPPRSTIQFFDKKPDEAAVYIQDKIELDYLIVNIGLRYDYFNANSYYYTNPGNILMNVTDDSGVSSLVAAGQETTKSKYKLSPRIGLAHPITETTVFHFAYGHFFQSPRFYDLYRNSDFDDITANDALIGNPGLEPEETVSFEAGIKKQIGNDYSVDVTAYYKDIHNLVSSFYFFEERSYTMYVNGDYGRVKGLDVTLNKRYSNLFGGSINYTYMIAKGNMSDPSEGYSQFREEDAHLRPNRNFYLDFDKRHTFNLNLGIRLPNDQGPELFNLYPLQNLAANFVFSAASGLPYTPSSRDPEATVLPEKNSARKAWTNQLDVRLSKVINIKSVKFDLYMKVENVFDRINVLRVWSRTGDPWDQGPTSNYSMDRQANPENVDIRRRIRAGIIIRL